MAIARAEIVWAYKLIVRGESAVQPKLSFQYTDYCRWQADQEKSYLNLPLKVGGTGRDLDRLKSIAGPTVEFLGFVPDDDLPELFARCRAFVFPGLEDFGITPVQAQATGRPVIAFAGGGALDTVIHQKTGLHFAEQTVEALMETLQQFNEADYDPALIRQHALQFDSDVFHQKISNFVDAAWQNKEGNPHD
jgi:glycosyltransferase involved in cell wall biosynthesis